MLSLSSPRFIQRSMCRPSQLLEPEFRFFSPWTSLADDDFIIGNYGFRRPALVSTYFFMDKSNVVEGKTNHQKKNCGTSTKCCQKERDESFRVLQNLEGFKPDEIDVSIDEDRLKIHAKSDNGNGNTSEMFKWYSLPENVDTDQLTSSLSRNGTLRVCAPLKKVVKETAENNPDNNLEETSSETNEPMEEAIDKELELDEKSTEEIKEHSKTVCKTGFHVELPMEQFKPEHVKVSVEQDKLKIHAKKVDESEGHFMQEEVTKWLSLPSDVDVSQLMSNIRDDKVLVINAPLRKKNEALTSANQEADDAEMMTTDDNVTAHAQER